MINWGRMGVEVFVYDTLTEKKLTLFFDTRDQEVIDVVTSKVDPTSSFRAPETRDQGSGTNQRYHWWYRFIHLLLRITRKEGWK